MPAIKSTTPRLTIAAPVPAALDREVRIIAALRGQKLRDVFAEALGAFVRRHAALLAVPPGAAGVGAIVDVPATAPADELRRAHRSAGAP